MNIIRILIPLFVIIITTLIFSIKPAINKNVQIDFTGKLINVENKTETIPEEELEIEWNTWHANIVNYILKNIMITDEEINTKNIVKFSIDKDGNIFNIKVTASPEKYSKVAGQIFKPVIQSLAKSEYAKFPKNSKRDIMECNYTFIASPDEKSMAKPDDFSDTEFVRK